MHRLWELSSLQTGLHRKGRTIVNKNIFLIDKDTKENLGDIDFIPKKEDRIIITRSWKRLEYKVKCIVHLLMKMVFLYLQNYQTTIMIKLLRISNGNNSITEEIQSLEIDYIRSYANKNVVIQHGLW